MKKLSPRTLSILKYLLSFLLLGFVLHKTGVEEVSGYMKEVSPLEMLMALILATAGQFFSALRMRYFFNAAGFGMSKHYAVVLYYVGAFYNFLLPGGVGGDAYKVILVRKRMEMPAKQGIRIMVADRASGLCIVLFTLYCGLYLLGFVQAIPYGGALLLLATIFTPLVYVVASRRLLKQLPLDMVGSLRYSILAQLCWMATLAMLWKSIGHGEHLVAYITLYAAATITSMIPVSPGGLGLRELTYVVGAKLMYQYMGTEVDAKLGVAISLCMFAVIFVSSLPGLLWLNKAGRADIAPVIKKDSYYAGAHDKTNEGRPNEEWF